MKKIKEGFSKGDVRKLMDDVNKSLKGVADKYGVNIGSCRASYNNTECKISVRFFILEELTSSDQCDNVTLQNGLAGAGTRIWVDSHRTGKKEHFTIHRAKRKFYSAADDKGKMWNIPFSMCHLVDVCNSVKKQCDFAGEHGDCTQPTIALELKCGG